ncbi:MAG: prepilin-type N-terminal cleavage/methylation domain-containing protein [Bacteriovoracaceae bacterium]|nr:prepilin-type N-terminal cleavage/methylation domain-containing protein [Bacteriovoracaceae bacterium]
MTNNPRSGFSLLEVMISVGIMSGIMMGITEMLVNPNKHSSEMVERISAQQDLTYGVLGLVGQIESSMLMKTGIIDCSDAAFVLSANLRPNDDKFTISAAEAATGNLELAIAYYDFVDNASRGVLAADGVTDTEASNTFSVTTPNKFKVGDPVVVSFVHNIGQGGLFVISDKVGGKIKLDAFAVTTNTPCKASSTALSVAELIFNAGTELPQAFRIFRVRFVTYSTESYRQYYRLKKKLYPNRNRNGAETRIVFQNFDSLSIEEHWAPDANNTLSGNFLADITVKATKSVLDRDREQTVATTASYRFESSLRSNYEAATGIKLPPVITPSLDPGNPVKRPTTDDCPCDSTIDYCYDFQPSFGDLGSSGSFTFRFVENPPVGCWDYIDQKSPATADYPTGFEPNDMKVPDRDPMPLYLFQGLIRARCGFVKGDDKKTTYVAEYTYYNVTLGITDTISSDVKELSLP